MLQVLIGINERYTVEEQARMAIDGGASWLILQCAGLIDEETRRLIEVLLPGCREFDVILTIEGNNALARETGVSGVLLDDDTEAVQVRKMLGPEAIIGVRCDEASRITALAKCDIDYVALSMRNPSSVVLSVREAGCRMPIVAYGDYRPSDVEELRYNGCDGICTGRYIFEADEPTACVRSFLRGK